ncbi:hypothetical protein HG537_0F03040 [Torulaspora globosa]|uniref:Sulfite efflux pump SSU1 n=1 Tax=Torulaspora globosa TaxID=48254 RepID=A0A7H9HW53_9SACH|nr:hypothetical protein HG537_0F03040 [Torulaspora sp. CBS 2947]
MEDSLFNRLTGGFEPFFYVMVMATGISSNLLHDFPYEARWLRYCSYPMFALACLLFIGLQIQQLLHMFRFVRQRSFDAYFKQYFRNPSHSVFWGTYSMGLITIVNYIATLAQDEVKNLVVSKRLMKMAYALWWYDVATSLIGAWGISFLLWQRFPKANNKESHLTVPNAHVSTEGLKSVLVLLVVPLVVASSSSSYFTMTDLFAEIYSRKTQLTILVITALIWLHAVIFVFIIITIFFWSLYVNKIPPMGQVFSLFLLLGPMGQASYGIVLLTEDVRLYVFKYYTASTTNQDILLLTVPWCIKIIGLLLALALLAMGYFFTTIGFAGVASYYRTTTEEEYNGQIRIKRIYHFHKGWFAMTFPMGTMSLGSTGIWHHYNQFVPMYAFRVIGTIYAVICIMWTLVCLIGISCTGIIPQLTHIFKHITTRDSVSEVSTNSSKTKQPAQSEVYSHLSC